MRLSIQTATKGGSQQNAVLDRLAVAAQRLGHDVARWTNRDKSHMIPGADVAILWNGLYDWARKLREDYPAQRFLFAELGWMPQEPCWQLDAAGPNALASWASDPLPVVVWSAARQPGGELLVVLQDDADTQVYTEYLSPMFRNMADFLRFLADNADAALRVRDHPAHPCSEEARSVVYGCNRMRWDESPSLGAALDGAAALLTINSSCGVWALNKGVPVVSFGRSVWTSVDGACYRIFGEPDPAAALKKAVGEIVGGANSLNRVAQSAALGRIIGKQWWPKHLPERLAWVLR